TEDTTLRWARCRGIARPALPPIPRSGAPPPPPRHNDRGLATPLRVFAWTARILPTSRPRHARWALRADFARGAAMTAERSARHPPGDRPLRGSPALEASRSRNRV